MADADPVKGTFWKIFLRVAIGSVLGLAALIFVVQASLIYHPRDYDHRYSSALEAVERLEFKGYRGKSQTAFLLAPETEPLHLWWIFGGNGSLALDWFGHGVGLDSDGIAVIFVDYPGYGDCNGRPSPERIQDSVDVLHALVAKRFRWSKAELSARSSALGHSLGAAVALDTAARHKMKHAVAISPFTTMKDMAKQVVGGLLSNLLTHRFDNWRSLEILTHRPDTRVTMFHGTNDEMIPISMSRDLKAKFPTLVKLIPVDQAGHNDVVYHLHEPLRELMREGARQGGDPGL